MKNRNIKMFLQDDVGKYFRALDRSCVDLLNFFMFLHRTIILNTMFTLGL